MNREELVCDNRVRDKLNLLRGRLALVDEQSIASAQKLPTPEKQAPYRGAGLRPSQQPCDTQPGALTLSKRALVLSIVLCVVASDVASAGQTSNITIRQAPLDELDGGVLVQTRSGSFRGLLLFDGVGARYRHRIPSAREDNNVAGFLGIRYASAPIKRLRFMPPTAYQYAPGRVHSAQKFGPICQQRWPTLQEPGGGEMNGTGPGAGAAGGWQMQMRVMQNLVAKESYNQLRPLLNRLELREQSEDCLNLNLYVPVEALKTSPGTSELRPVLVIIHGESTDYGSGSTINGFRFAQQNRLLAVTFNYRLNLLGFPPKLLGASRGNLGLMDQVAALHWIKDNIGSFGGSPGNITLMGARGNAAIFVNLLMLSPLAKGLFQRAVMEDGSALTPLVANHLIVSGSAQYPQAAVQHLRLLAKLCDCPPNERAAERIGAESVVSKVSQTSNNLLLDEARINSLTFECLRQKPADLLMQPVPLDLLNLGQQTKQLTMNSRWLSLIGQQVQTDSSLAGEVVANSSLIRQLLAAAASRLAPRDQAEKQESDEELDKLALDLLSATYGAAQGQGLRPMFGPQLDGTIVPNEDIATLMLKPQSVFGQRDLLIGLTQPALASVRTLSDNLVNSRQVDEATLLPLSQTNSALAPWKLFLHREKEGLSNEQALEMANSFVRSFYRYHNQEIANSILNHYLLNAGRSPSDNQRGAQLLVMDSLFSAIQDALINVPLLKTSLIHATRQLEPLVEPFTAQLFARWLQQQRGQQPVIATVSANETLEQFIAFASTLFRDPSWPLRLVTMDQEPVQQPRATYLYQFSADHLLEQIKLLLLKHQQEWPQTPGWQALKDALASLLIKMHGSQLRHRLSFGCALEFSDGGDSEQAPDLVAQVMDAICSQLGATLGNFVASGNANSGNNPYLEAADEQNDLQTQVEKYETGCVTSLPSGDHHKVQVKHSGDLNNPSCQQGLSGLVLNCLFASKGEEPGGDQHLASKWPVFSLFNQQVITLPQLGPYRSYHVSQVGGSASGESRKLAGEQWNFAARSSFWANFIPALNCSRTQPVVPSALLAMGQSTNASLLLNLNLQFNCQQGSKTAFSSLEQVAGSISQQLQVRANTLRMEQQRHQNHHSLRMTNQSGADFDSASPDSTLLDSQQQTLTNDSSAVQLSQPVPDFISVRQNNGNAARAGEEQQARAQRYASFALLVCGLLLSASLVSGAYALLARKQRIARERGKKTLNGASDKSSPEETTNNSRNNTTVSTNDDQSPGSIEDHGFAPPSNQGELMLESIVELDSQIEQRAVQVNGETALMMDDQQAGNLDAQAGFLYWNQGQGQGRTMSMCRSHSAMSMANGLQSGYVSSTLQRPSSHLSGSFVMNEQPSAYFNLNGQYQQQQQPIMVPLLTSSGDVQRQIYTGGQILAMQESTIDGNSKPIMTNGFPHGDSSSETQGGQSSASLSTIKKKRVKISDPPASSSSRSSTLKRQTYCPVHQRIRTQHLTSQEPDSIAWAASQFASPNEYGLDSSYVAQVDNRSQRQRQQSFHCPHQQQQVAADMQNYDPSYMTNLP